MDWDDSINQFITYSFINEKILSDDTECDD